MAGSRTVTVLVADVVGSTELFSDLGVDQADAARRLVFQAFETAIEAADGQLVKTMGDGCLASFGSAADAVTAAVTIQQSVAMLRDRKVPGLAMRVGVAVGDVTEEGDDIFGPAVVTASRLCGAAGPHQVLATDMVRMLAGDRGGHRYDAAGDLILKGIAEPIAACAVRYEAGASARLLPPALAATPSEVMVGRDDELDVLVDAAKAAATGERRAVLVAGEPGVGKTRLVAAVARRAFDQGALVLFGRCEEDLAVAYQPFAEALRAGTADVGDDVVRAHIAAHGGEIARLVPTLEAPEPARGEPATEQARLFDAVTDLLHRAAAERPVVLVLDDLHWAAPATISLLRHLLNANPRHRLCVLGTYRDTEVDRTHALGGLLADLHRIEGAERLALRGLDGSAMEDLLAAVSGDDLDEDGQALAAAVVSRTAGNPFFAGQVLRHLVERGVLVQEDGRWRVHGSLAEVDLPEGVLDVVGRRLSRLSEGANQAMTVAALCGLEFGARVLCAVPDAGGADAVVDGLDEAVRARLLVETGPGRFAFAHAIVRDALNRELTTAKRARFHRSIANGILAVYGDAPELPLAELARHFTEAAVLGDTAAAARWAVAAADAASAQADHRGAIAVLDRALTVVEAVEPVDQAARFDVAAGIAERRYQLMEADPDAIAAAVDAARHLRSGDRMLHIAAARWIRGAGIPDPEGIALCTEALDLLDDDSLPYRVLAHAVRAGLTALQGSSTFAEDVRAVVEHLPEIDAVAPRVAAASRLWVVFSMLGVPGAEHRLSLCDEGLALWHATDDPWMDRLDVHLNFDAFLIVYRGHALLGLGRRDGYEANHATFREMGERTGNLFMVAQAHVGDALLALMDGRLDDVAAAASTMLMTASDDENFRLSYMGYLGRIGLEQGRAGELASTVDAARAISPDLALLPAVAAHFLVLDGRPDAAHELLASFMDGWAGWTRDWTWPMALTEGTEAVVALGAVEHAPTFLAELETYGREVSVIGAGILCLGAYDRYRGMLLTLLGRHDEAVTALEAALAIETPMPAPSLSGWTQHHLAAALLRRDGRGDRDRAEALLTSSIDAADTIGLTALAAANRDLRDATS